MDASCSLEYVFLILCIIHVFDLWRISCLFFLRRIFHNRIDEIILFLQRDKPSQSCQTQVNPISRSPQFHSNFFNRSDFCVQPASSNSWFPITLWWVMNPRKRWLINKYFWCHFIAVWQDPWWSIFLLIFFSRFTSIHNKCFELFP